MQSSLLVRSVYLVLLLALLCLPKQVRSANLFPNFQGYTQPGVSPVFGPLAFEPYENVVYVGGGVLSSGSMSNAASYSWDFGANWNSAPGSPYLAFAPCLVWLTQPICLGGITNWQSATATNAISPMKSDLSFGSTLAASWQARWAHSAVVMNWDNDGRTGSAGAGNLEQVLVVMGGAATGGGCNVEFPNPKSVYNDVWWTTDKSLSTAWKQTTTQPPWTARYGQQVATFLNGTRLVLVGGADANNNVNDEVWIGVVGSTYASQSFDIKWIKVGASNAPQSAFGYLYVSNSLDYMYLYAGATSSSQVSTYGYTSNDYGFDWTYSTASLPSNSKRVAFGGVTIGRQLFILAGASSLNLETIYNDVYWSLTLY